MVSSLVPPGSAIAQWGKEQLDRCEFVYCLMFLLNYAFQLCSEPVRIEEVEVVADVRNSSCECLATRAVPRLTGKVQGCGSAHP